MPNTARAPDVIVIGAGILGLCAAWACLRRGLRVTVLEKDRPGAGASGGPVGALAPFAPDPWSEDKAFQAKALSEAGHYWSSVAEAGGGDPGFGCLGRVSPLTDPAGRRRAEASAHAAAQHWPQGFSYRVSDGHPALDPGLAPFGVVEDTLTGRLDPPRAVAALAAALTSAGAELIPGATAIRVHPDCVETATGFLRSAAVILAAGAACAPLIPGPSGCAAIRGDAGQALRLRPLSRLDGPLRTAPGLYVVPHVDGTVGVGSTRDRMADGEDHAKALDTLRARAETLVPEFAGARVLVRWSGDRPRAPKPRPLVGPMPGQPSLVLATGGLGIGFALAPAIGDAAAAMVMGETPDLPAAFAPGAHGIAPA